jgi:hypothetical protein
LIFIKQSWAILLHSSFFTPSTKAHHRIYSMSTAAAAAAAAAAAGGGGGGSGDNGASKRARLETRLLKEDVVKTITREVMAFKPVQKLKAGIYSVHFLYEEYQQEEPELFFSLVAQVSRYPLSPQGHMDVVVHKYSDERPSWTVTSQEALVALLRPHITNGNHVVVLEKGQEDFPRRVDVDPLLDYTDEEQLHKRFPKAVHAQSLTMKEVNAYGDLVNRIWLLLNDAR